MKLDEPSEVQSHLLGRILAIEQALNIVITANPHSHEIAGAIQHDLQALTEHGLSEPARDGLLEGIAACQKSLLRGL